MYYIYFKKDWYGDWIGGISYFPPKKGNDLANQAKWIFPLHKNQRKYFQQYFIKIPYTLQKAKREYLRIIFTVFN